MKIVKALDEVEIGSAFHPRRRVVVLERDDGNFSYAEQYHFISEHDGEVVTEGWVTLSPDGIHASAEVAEAECRAAFQTWYPPPTE